MKEKRCIRFLSIIIAVILLSVSIMTDNARSAIPETINYQGYLTDSGGTPVNSPRNMTFKIYNQSGTLLWTETQNNVPVTNGIYNVTLGSMASLGTLAFDVPYFLGVTVGTDDEMIPRQPLTSVAYALTADTALNVANNVVTSTMIQNGAVLSEDVNFNYAGSTSKGGPATNLSCTGCVSQSVLADNAVNSTKIENGSILFGDIGGNGCTANQIMKYSGTAWGCDADANTTYSAGTGITLDGTQFRVSTPLYLSGSSMGGILFGQNATEVYGNSSGVKGLSTTATLYTFGVHGEATGPFGTGVYGFASSQTGYTNGVFGQNESTSGMGVYGLATADTGTTHGVAGVARSADGYGGYFTNSKTTTTGVALKAAGTGIIQSTAKSYLWISGNGARKYYDADTTIIDMTNVGGAVIQRGANTGNKNVILPIPITGPLYGQAVTITGVDIYWKGETVTDMISAVLMRRQTGVCGTADCFVNIIYDSSDHACASGSYAKGCTIPYTGSAITNNILTADSGIIYLTIEFAFNSATNQIWIGGVRLTLEHD
jgi:hypothetical protein